MKKLTFFIAFLALVLGFGLRYQSSQTLHSLAESVARADAAGQDIVAPLARTQAFAAAHMSAPLRIILKASHQRAVEAAQAAAQPGVSNAQVYAQAQAACAGRGDSITQARCNQDYISKNLKPAAAPPPISQPKLSDYTHEIRSPIWTPDAAGLCLVAAVAAAIVGLILVNLQPRRRT